MLHVNLVTIANIEDESVAEARSLGSNVEDASNPNDAEDMEKESFGCEDG